MERKYSTVEVAKKLGIAQPNLQRLIRTGRIEAPPIQSLGRVKIRLWSDEDIKKARKAIKGER
jgi:predicted site-specific integrase-resolvase